MEIKALRQITFTCTEKTISPSTPQWAGVQNEHNASEVVFDVKFKNEPEYKYRIEFEDGMGCLHTTSFLPIVENKVSYKIPNAWTSPGGVGTVWLVVAVLNAQSLEEQIILSLKGRLKFDSSSSSSSPVDDDFCGGIGNLIDRAEKAAAESEQSAEDSLLSANSAEMFASDAEVSAIKAREDAIGAHNAAERAALSSDEASASEQAAFAEANRAKDEADRAKREADRAEGAGLYVAQITSENGRLVCDRTSSEIIDASRNSVCIARYTDAATGELRDYYFAKQTADRRAAFSKDGYIENNDVKQTIIYIDYAGNVTVETRTVGANSSYAICSAAADPIKSEPVFWYVPKTYPKPSGKIGSTVDVFWKKGRVGGIGYNITLVWGEEGGTDNEIIFEGLSTKNGLTGEYDIPTEGTVRYQIGENNGRKFFEYVSGNLISKSFSTSAEPGEANKSVPGMEMSYVRGMEIFVQFDKGNTSDTINLVPESGETMPVYGNGTGRKAGAFPSGYILHLKSAGAYWQIINGASGSGGGTSDHSVLINRDIPNQHPISAITGLSAALTGKQPAALVVNITTTDGKTGTADKSSAEIVQFMTDNPGADVTGFLDVAGEGIPLFLLLVSGGMANFVSSTNITASIVTQAQCTVYDDKSVTIETPVFDKSLKLSPLNFTGASTGTYDGSAPLTIDIPAGGGGAEWTKIGTYPLANSNSGKIWFNTSKMPYNEYYFVGALPNIKSAKLFVFVGTSCAQMVSGGQKQDLFGHFFKTDIGLYGTVSFFDGYNVAQTGKVGVISSSPRNPGKLEMTLSIEPYGQTTEVAQITFYGR